MKPRLIEGLVILFFSAAIVLGVGYLIHLLYLFVIQALWPTGPDNLVHMGYATFLGAWVFIGVFARMLRGGK